MRTAPIIIYRKGEILDYTGLYTVTEDGKVFSIGKNRYVTIKTWKNNYKAVMLHKDSKRTFTSLSRIVADAFLPLDPTRQEINHKDGNKSNNHISNLERCTSSENKKHCYDVLGKKKLKPQLGKFGKLHTRSKPIYALKEDNEIFFESMRLAAKNLGLYQGSIWNALKGNYTHKSGYKFKYA